MKDLPHSCIPLAISAQHNMDQMCTYLGWAKWVKPNQKSHTSATEETMWSTISGWFVQQLSRSGGPNMLQGAMPLSCVFLLGGELFVTGNISFLLLNKLLGKLSLYKALY